MCEESSNSEESVHHPCREGYVCDFGTTPDPDLEAPEGQFTQLCPVGYVCTDATGLGQAYRQVWLVVCHNLVRRWPRGAFNVAAASFFPTSKHARLLEINR